MCNIFGDSFSYDDVRRRAGRHRTGRNVPDGNSGWPADDGDMPTWSRARPADPSAGRERHAIRERTSTRLAARTSAGSDGLWCSIQRVEHVWHVDNRCNGLLHCAALRLVAGGGRVPNTEPWLDGAGLCLCGLSRSATSRARLAPIISKLLEPSRLQSSC